MRSQNVSFWSIFHVFTIRFHFSGGVSARAEPHAESERIVFVYFSWVYDTFSLFLRRFKLHGASCGVRTYRFCPFFMGLRYVFTFSAAFQPVISTLHGVGRLSYVLIIHQKLRACNGDRTTGRTVRSAETGTLQFREDMVKSRVTREISHCHRAVLSGKHSFCISLGL